MHIVRPETLVYTVVGQLIDADEQWIGPLGNLEGVADMVAVGMGQDDEIGGDISRFYRGSWVAVEEGINQQHMTEIGGDLK